MPKNLTINLKIIAMQCISLVLLIGALGYCLFQLESLSKENKDSISNANIASSVMVQLDNMNIAVIREAKAAKDVWLRGTDLEEKEKFKMEFTDQIDIFNTSSSTAKEGLDKLVKEDVSLVKFQEGLEKVAAEHKRVADIYLAQIDVHVNAIDSDQKVGGGNKKLFRQIQLLRNDFVGTLEKKGVASLELIDQQFKTKRIILAIIAVVSIVLLTVVSLFIARSIIRPLNSMQSTIATVEKSGDFTHRIVITSHDEVGKTAKSFNDLMGSLQASLRKILDGVDQVSDSAKSLTALSTQVSTSSSAQSEASSAMAATVEQVTVSIGEVSSSAREAQEISSKSGELSNEGGSIIHNAATEMTQIAEIVRQTSVDIEKLGQQSNQISSVVQVIREVADQTNLLALNAAIEAARAGEQGRGFAVVADEVRKLAERTTNATLEIGKMITSIQESSRTAVSSMQVAVDRVGGGVELAQKAGDAINQIKEGASQVINVVNNISSALTEQSSASNDIATQVEKVAQMSEKNNAAASEAATAATHLESLASDIRQTVRQFKI
jgi:methyl-accepting chemotaxis protein